MSCRAKIPPIPSQFSFFFPQLRQLQNVDGSVVLSLFFVVLLPIFF